MPHRHRIVADKGLSLPVAAGLCTVAGSLADIVSGPSQGARRGAPPAVAFCPHRTAVSEP